jgi:threonine/homoserine/homoserine lactone efflux protein
MPDATTFALFALACLAFLAIPGPSVFYIVTRSFVQGRRAGATSMLGVQAGGLVHVVAAAFTVVKYAGAAYLVFLGLRRLFGPEPDEPALEGGPASTARLFGRRLERISGGVFVGLGVVAALAGEPRQS